MQTTENTSKQAPCLTCKHYVVTWDKHLPYGCKAFRFKSAILPCHDVRNASSFDCLKYEPKPESQ